MSKPTPSLRFDKATLLSRAITREAHQGYDLLSPCETLAVAMILAARPDLEEALRDLVAECRDLQAWDEECAAEAGGLEARG